MRTITIFPDNQSFSSRQTRSERFWLSIFRWLLHRKCWTARGTAANRYYSSGIFGCFAVSLTLKDLREMSGYTREELYEMLQTIRREERSQSWKVPEPE